MTHPRFHARLVQQVIYGGAVGVVMMVGLSLAQGVTPAVLVDDTLTQQQVKLIGLHDGELSFFDDQRQLRHVSTDGFVQLRMLRDTPMEGDLAGAGMIQLIDGQRFAGQWAGASADGQGLRWASADFGDLTVPLDDVSYVSWFGSQEQGDRHATYDTVTLTNGDQLRGFISELADEHLTLTPADAPEPIILPIARLTQMTIAHALGSTHASAQRITLHDGSVIDGQSLDLARERLMFDAALPGQPVKPITLPLERLHQIDFVTQGLRLRSLVAMPWRIVAGGEVFGLATPVRVVGEDLLLHAPVRVQVDVSETTRRLVCVAEIDWTGVLAEVRDWADCELVIYRSHDDDQPLRYRLNAEHPRVALNIVLTGCGLMLEVDPGVNGPILDRVRLREGQLLEIGPPAIETSPATHQ